MLNFDGLLSSSSCLSLGSGNRCSLKWLREVFEVHHRYIKYVLSVHHGLRGCIRFVCKFSIVTTDRKRSLRQGNVFTGVFLSTGA